VVDVDQHVRAFDTQLHQVDEVRPARKWLGPRPGEHAMAAATLVGRS